MPTTFSVLSLPPAVPVPLIFPIFGRGSLARTIPVHLHTPCMLDWSAFRTQSIGERALRKQGRTRCRGALLLTGWLAHQDLDLSLCLEGLVTGADGHGIVEDARRARQAWLLKARVSFAPTLNDVDIS